MSAKAQARSLYSLAPRSLSPVELLRALSHITWSAPSQEQALSAIAAVLQRSPGITGFRFEPSDASGQVPINQPSGSRASTANAVAAAFANGHHFGHVRLFFDTQSIPISESPLRLARFVGQQLGILLHRLVLQRNLQTHKSRIHALSRLTQRRKTIHRALSILARQRDVSRTEACSLLVQYARRNKKNLLEIAKSLIFGFDSAAFTGPSLRRLPSSVARTKNLPTTGSKGAMI